MSYKKTKARERRRLRVLMAIKERRIRVIEIAAKLGISKQAIYRHLAVSPQIVAALIEAGVPARLFKGRGQD